jgi:hypothetical protein
MDWLRDIDWVTLIAAVVSSLGIGGGTVALKRRAKAKADAYKPVLPPDRR